METLRSTWTQAKKELVSFPRRARRQAEEWPRELVGALDRAAVVLRARLDLPSGAEVRALTARVDDLAKKVDRLTRERATKASKVVRLPKKN